MTHDFSLECIAFRNLESRIQNLESVDAMLDNVGRHVEASG